MLRVIEVAIVLFIGLGTGCGDTVTGETLHIRLAAKPQPSVANHTDKDGEARFEGKKNLAIEGTDGKVLKLQSHMTFVSVRNGVVTRVVCTPMPKDGDLVDATDSLKSLVEWMPEGPRRVATEWIKKVLEDKDTVPDELSRHSKKFDLPQKIEVYIEIRPRPDASGWYTSIHIYAE